MKTAYFSCGAGDFIAIESFLTIKQKKEIGKFVLFTRAASVIEEIISLHPIWEKCEVVIPLSPDEILGLGIYSFFSIPKMKKKTNQEWPLLDGAIDYSGDFVYPHILSGVLRFTESLFEVKPIAIDIACDSASHADVRLSARGRNFTEREMDYVRGLSKEKTVKFLGIDKTTVTEALGYVRGCDCFYGVDSMLSVWAGRQASIKNIVVKTVNDIYRKWRPVYDPFRVITVVDNICDTANF